ncbi:hypothetical protein SGPA1_40095 [Streptomyces misionensis JCM 4497]
MAPLAERALEGGAGRRRPRGRGRTPRAGPRLRHFDRGRVPRHGRHRHLAPLVQRVQPRPVTGPSRRGPARPRLHRRRRPRPVRRVGPIRQGPALARRHAAGRTGPDAHPLTSRSLASQHTTGVHSWVPSPPPSVSPAPQRKSRKASI